MTVIVELAGEPKGKGRPRFVRATGIAFTPETTRSYETNLRYAAQVAMSGAVPFEGPLRVIVTATMAIPQSWSNKRRVAALAGLERPTKKPDWENIAKMLDAFNEVVWRDDSQVVEGTIVKQYGERAFLRVEVSEVLLVRTPPRELHLFGEGQNERSMGR